MAALVHVFDHYVRERPPPPAPSNLPSWARQTRGLSPETRTDLRGSYGDDAVLISSDDSDEDFDDSQSDIGFPPIDEIMASYKNGRHGINSTANAGEPKIQALALSGAALEINGTHAITEVPRQTSQVNGSSTMEPAVSPTPCELPDPPSVSARAPSNAPTPRYDAEGVGDSKREGVCLKRNIPQQSSSPRRYISPLAGSCDRDEEQALENADRVMPLQHGRYHDTDSSGDESVEGSAVDLSWTKAEYAEEGDGAIESLPKAQGASVNDAITGQLDDDEGDGDEDDEANDTQLDNVGTPRPEMIDRGARAETPDTECDTQSDTECDTQSDGPMQLPGPPKHKYLSRSCRRMAGALRTGDQPREDGDLTPPLQHKLHRDVDSSEDEKDDEDDVDYDPETLRPPRKRRKLSRRGPTPKAKGHRSPGSSRARRARERLTSHDLPETRMATDTVQASYQEWPLQDVSLKRVTEGGRTVFQLQFAWDSCPQRRRKGQGQEHGSTGRRYGTSTQSQRTGGAMFTKDEDTLLIKLKGDGLTWRDIHRRYSKDFPGRSKGALQVRYSTKLKGK